MVAASACDSVPRMRLSGALLVAAVLGLSGCGSSSSSPSSADQSTGTSDSSTDNGSAATALPGGTSGRDVIKAHHLLDAQGRVAPGPTAPKGNEVNAAICDYVFGTPSEVEKTAKLSGTVTLNNESGYLYNGGGGSGVQCVYQVAADKQVLMLTIWSHAATDASGVTSFVQVPLHDGFQGSSGYAPKYKGRTMERSRAKQWLKEAGSRVAHGSV